MSCSILLFEVYIIQIFDNKRNASSEYKLKYDTF